MPDDDAALHGQADAQADRQADTQTGQIVHGAGMSRRKRKERNTYRIRQYRSPNTPVRRHNGTVANSAHRRTGTQAHRNTGRWYTLQNTDQHAVALICTCTCTCRAGGQGRPRTGRDPGSGAQERAEEARTSLNSTPSVSLCSSLLSPAWLVTSDFRPRPCQACLPACPTWTPASRPKLGLPHCPKPFRGPTLGESRYTGTPYPAPVPVPGTVPVPVLNKEQGTRSREQGAAGAGASKQAETWLSLLLSSVEH